jgi:acyl-CoA reductase-like NAD-dependent aldehyde dehydrogenase
VAALRAGRAVIIKSSPKAPSALLAVCEVFARSGFPGGMVNVVHGDEAVVVALCASEAIEALAYVGGAGVGDKVRALAAGSGKPLIGGAAGDELLHAWRCQLGFAA